MTPALRALVPIAWMAVIWLLSSAPSATFPRWTFAELQSAAHIILFAILSACWYWALAPTSASAASWAFAAAVTYGGIDELHQSFVPGRMSSLADLSCDAIGAGLVVLVIGALRWRRRSSIDAAHAAARGTRKLTQRSTG